VDDETALRILLADNKTADLGSYDEDLLTELLDGLDTLAGTGWGPLAVAEEKIEEAAAPVAEPEEADDDGEVPDDKYEPQWGIMIVCTSEDQQAETYVRLKEFFETNWDDIPDMKVVAT
jgi:hypothetical protein